MNIETLEQFLQSQIFPDLAKGDPNRDLPHTISIARKIKSIISNSPDFNLDLQVLLTSAYCHDWGYSPFFKEGGESLSFAEYATAKKKHMETGAEMTIKLLTNPFFEFLTLEQKDRIVHLVRVHDNVDSLKDVDELVLMEADTLAGLDTDYIKPTFSKEENKKYIEIGVKGKRLSKFITNYGKKMAEVYLKKREEYYKKHSEL